MRVTPTLAVRRAMQSMGYHVVYTNKYKTMRTVKCYGSGPELEGRLRLVLFVLGIQPKFRKGRRGRCTIVQLPL